MATVKGAAATFRFLRGGMRVIPVIDVMGGQVVRAVGGRRDEYRPVLSRLTESTDPASLARALIDATGAAELYVADLDAIRGHPTRDLNRAALESLSRLPHPVWVDAGLRDEFDEVALLQAGISRFVIGTETAAGCKVVGRLAAMSGGDRVALSLDLRGGEWVGNGRTWGERLDEALPRVVAFATGVGITRLIVLDLVAVGEGGGPMTGDVCRRIKACGASVEVWTGGGVRDWDDVRRLEDAGADAVLVASALHDGTLTFPRPTP